MVDPTIRKGDRFYCHRDVVMEDGEITYARGGTYTSEENGYITNGLGEKNHEWRNEPGEDSWWDYFTRTPHPVEKCNCPMCQDAKDLVK